MFQEFGAHKLFLAMSSPVFEAMFFGGMAEKSDPIPILDVQPEAFKALLEYDFFILCFLFKHFKDIKGSTFILYDDVSVEPKVIKTGSVTST